MGGPETGNLQQIEVSKPHASQSLQLASSCCLGRLHVILPTGANEVGGRLVTHRFYCNAVDTSNQSQSAGMYSQTKTTVCGDHKQVLCSSLHMIVQFFPQADSRCQQLHYQKKKFALQPWHVNSDLWNSSDRVLLYSTSTPHALLPNIPNVEGM